MNSTTSDPYGLVEARAAAADIVAIYCDAVEGVTPERRQGLRYLPVIGVQLRPIGLYDTQQQRLAASLRPVQPTAGAPVTLVVRWLWDAALLGELDRLGQALSLENELRRQEASPAPAAPSALEFGAGGGGA